jgi:nitrous oxidase accessory protein
MRQKALKNNLHLPILHSFTMRSIPLTYRLSFKLLSMLAFTLLIAGMLFAVAVVEAQSEGEIVTPQGTYSSLSQALAEAQDGDIIEVFAGTYSGSFEIDRSVQLIGHHWPVIDGGGEGTVIQVLAPDVTISGFVIKNSGDSLAEENSGIAVEAPGAIMAGNRLEDTLFGIYLKEADGSIIRDNDITSKDLDVPRRGDPIRVWFSHDVLIENNEVHQGRDVVLWYSERLTVRDNQVADGRYGLHFMYCDDATIENNLLTNNSVGTFLMYSRRLNLANNTIAHNRGPSGYGIGLKDMDDAAIENNLFLDNRVGAHLDNSPREVNSIGLFEGNVFAFNDIGITLMPSVRHNQFQANSFIDNEEQINIAGRGGRAEDNVWTVENQGNYWSDYIGYDGNADGLGDVPYRSQRLFESLTDNDSSLRLFLYSPVEQAVDFAARAIPFVKPQPKMSDDAPLMDPVMPQGLPSVPRAGAETMWMASIGMLLLAGSLLSLAAIRKRRIKKNWFEFRDLEGQH